MLPVRVRFAPSPTGMLHVGALRDALHKHLLAKKTGGQNILRIEDTDRSRYSAESEEEFVQTLRWVGIDFDEGPHVGGPHAPYRQSERKEAGVYAPYVQELLEKGAAYKAFETPEELTAMRDAQTAAKGQTGYFGGAWRDASPEQVAQAESEGKPYVVRLRIPRDTTIAIEDAIRGRVEWDSNTVDDPVLIKADGMPTYHFASMVDDHLMQITHIMRGEEWLSSAPKHAVLFDAFGWERPVFVHCPVIVGNDGKKLSKRHGATRVLDYMAQGFLSKALTNFIALIGWSPGDDREAMDHDELVQAFDLSGLQPSPGKFDVDKLKWLNGHHIRHLPLDDLANELRRFVADGYTRNYWQSADEDGTPRDTNVLRDLDLLAEALANSPTYARQALALLQERVVVLSDFGAGCRFFFVREVEFDPKAVDKWFGQPHVAKLFDHVIAALGYDEQVQIEGRYAGTAPTAQDCERIVQSYASEEGFDKLGPIVHPLRVALTGKTVGPGLFELMEVLGPDRMIARLRRAKTLLSQPKVVQE